MDSVLLIVFLICIVAILHTYLFYPLFLFAAPGSKQKVKTNVYTVYEELPEITVIIAAYNEEQVIGEKISSVLNSGYPEYKIRILVGSDASTDRTNEIVTAFASSNEKIKLVEFSARSGKIKIVNRLAEMASTQILILTDANVFFRDKTLFHLVKHFKDPNVGQVCANIIKVSESTENVARQEKSYLDLENNIKLRESNLWGFVIGAEGGCNAVRKENFCPVPENFRVDDFYTTMSIIESGKRVVFEQEAVCVEDVTSSASVEFARKVRISTGNFQNLARFKKVLLKFWTPLSFAFWSHKVLRWFTPFFLIACFVSSLMLGFYNYNFFILAGLQLLGFVSPLLNSFPPFRLISHFYFMNLALLKGYFVFKRGVKTSIWEPTRRNV